ncbi:MAG: hypothetical protein ACK559_42070, partial [bacterium]
MGEVRRIERRSVDELERDRPRAAVGLRKPVELHADDGGVDRVVRDAHRLRPARHVGAARGDDDAEAGRGLGPRLAERDVVGAHQFPQAVDGVDEREPVLFARQR